MSGRRIFKTWEGMLSKDYVVTHEGLFYYSFTVSARQFNDMAYDSPSLRIAPLHIIELDYRLQFHGYVPVERLTEPYDFVVAPATLYFMRNQYCLKWDDPNRDRASDYTFYQAFKQKVDTSIPYALIAPIRKDNAVPHSFINVNEKNMPYDLKGGYLFDEAYFNTQFYQEVRSAEEVGLKQFAVLANVV